MSKSFKIPNDYNIYSALSTGKVSESIITTLFLKRGIILSNKTKYTDIVEYVNNI